MWRRASNPVHFQAPPDDVACDYVRADIADESARGAEVNERSSISMNLTTSSPRFRWAVRY